MEKYEDQLFKYLTEDEEKFKSAFEINQHFTTLKEKLIHDFWEEVINEIQKSNKEYLKEWQFVHAKRYNHFIIKHPKIPHFYIGFHEMNSHPKFGIWHDYNNCRFDISDSEIIEALNSYNYESEFWLHQLVLPFNFNEVAGLIKILPSSREDQIKSTIDVFDSFFSEQNIEQTLNLSKLINRKLF